MEAEDIFTLRNTDAAASERFSVVTDATADAALLVLLFGFNFHAELCCFRSFEALLTFLVEHFPLVARPMILQIKFR